MAHGGERARRAVIVIIASLLSLACVSITLVIAWVPASYSGR
jgi:hypothetical protein